MAARGWGKTLGKSYSTELRCPKDSARPCSSKGEKGKDSQQTWEFQWHKREESRMGGSLGRGGQVSKDFGVQDYTQVRLN